MDDGITNPPHPGYLSIAGLSPPQRVPRLKKPELSPSPAVSSQADQDARSLLIGRRAEALERKVSEHRLRNKFSLAKLRKKASSQDEEHFSLHEVATAVSAALWQDNLPEASVFRALLHLAPGADLSGLWQHSFDAKPTRRLPGLLGKHRQCEMPAMTWLDQASRLEDSDLLHALCEKGPHQLQLDRALGTALQQHGLRAVSILLSYGAIGSAHKGIIRDIFASANGLELARLLAAAPDSAMTADAWSSCLDPQNLRSHAIFSTCIAHRPNIASEKLLLATIEAQNLAAAAVLFAYAEEPQVSLADQRTANIQACSINNDADRHGFLKLFNEAGLLVDDHSTRRQLLHSVVQRNADIAHMLVDAGVKVDSHDCNALRRAIQDRDIELTYLLSKSQTKTTIGQALDHLPDGHIESDALALIQLLKSKGFKRGNLDAHLVAAAAQSRILLVKALISLGASTESLDGRALQEALSLKDLNIFKLLMQQKCSPEKLSMCISTALTIHEKPTRLCAMRILLQNGVLYRDLVISLSSLLSATGTFDADLIGLLLEHGAPVADADVDGHSCLELAARKGDLPVTRMLVSVEHRREVLAAVVPIVYALKQWLENETLSVLGLLCLRGAKGKPMEQTLLKAMLESRLEVAKLLLKNGANPNFDNGSAFVAAFTMHPPDRRTLLRLMCTACPPTSSSVESVVLEVASWRELPSLEDLGSFLSSSSASAQVLEALWPGLSFQVPKKVVVLLPCFLDHGFDVNCGEGDVLRFAVEGGYCELLDRLLQAGPDLSSLRAAFNSTSKVDERSVRQHIIKRLLETAAPVEIGQTQLLLPETQIALASDDSVGLEVLLRYNADVDGDHGSALCKAAVANKTRIVDMMLARAPAFQTLAAACLGVARSSLGHKAKQDMYCRFLAVDAMKENVSQFLALAMDAIPRKETLLLLLLDCGARADLRTLKSAVKYCPTVILQKLLAHANVEDAMATAFRYARASKMSADRRLEVYKCLLASPMPKTEITKALLSFLEADIGADSNVTKLLLAHDADVGTAQCKAIRLAVASGSVATTKLLVQYISDDTAASEAFDILQGFHADCERVGRDICRDLLQHWNIRSDLIDKALCNQVKLANTDVNDVELLLQAGANPNKNRAAAFIAAATADKEGLFKALSKYADVDIVARALIHSKRPAETVLKWLRVTLAQLPDGARIRDKELLFDCLQQYPASSTLISCLLQSGAPAHTSSQRRLHSRWRKEPVPFFLWALASGRKVHVPALHGLLGGLSEELATYTSEHGVSAAFCCLLHDDRSTLLARMLDRWEPLVAAQEVPMSTLAIMGVAPGTCVEESDLSGLQDRVPLRLAALYLGNLAAFRLLDRGYARNDGSLHLAALMALPRFVEHLLETHDPDLKDEDFDQRVPLALACEAKEVPWCRIANEEADFQTRLKMTMKLLAPRTSPKWRYRGETVLHIALRSGLQTTVALTEALSAGKNRPQLSSYVYIDRAGKNYSPVEYVKELMGGTETEKTALIACLTKAGLGR